MPDLDLDRMEQLAAREADALKRSPEEQAGFTSFISIESAELLSAARTFVPAAIAEIRRLRAEVDRLNSFTRKL